MSQHRKLLCILALAAVLYAASAFLYDLIINSYGADVGQYLVLARSLAGGQGYRYISLPEAPPGGKYPFAYPALLAPVVSAWPESLLAARLLAVLIGVGAIVACYVYVRREAPQWATMVTALFAFSVFTVSTSSYPQSDLPFTLFVLLSLATTQVYAGRQAVLSVTLLATVVLALAAMYTRLVGIVLIPALTGSLLLRRQIGKAILLGTLLTIGYFPWFYYSYQVNGSFIEATYQSDFFLRGSGQRDLSSVLYTLTRTAATNLVWYATLPLPDAVTGVFTGQMQGLAARLGLSSLLPLVGVSISAILLVGYVRRLRKGAGPAELFVALYLLVLFMDAARFVRFLVPILPLLYVYFFEAINLLGSRLPVQRLIRLVAVLILALMLVRVAAYYEKGLRYEQTLRSSGQDWITWIRENVENDALIMSGSPHILFFQTNRSGMGYPANACQLEVFVGKLSARWPTYVALHPVYGAFTPPQRCIEAAIRQYPGRFTQVYRNAPAQIAIYRISEP